MKLIDQRFTEFYHWDTYWAITGMLLSGMNQSVKGILENFYHVVCTYGFLPNGGRIYYLSRSHPPFLMRMVIISGSRITNEISYSEKLTLYQVTLFIISVEMNASGFTNSGGNYSRARDKPKLKVINHVIVSLS